MNFKSSVENTCLWSWIRYVNCWGTLQKLVLLNQVTKYWVKQCSKVIFPSEVPIVLGKCLSKSYHVGRKIVTYNLISKSIGRKSKRKFYVWPSIPIPVWLFIVLYAQAGGLTHWLVMPFTLWSGAKIDFIWLIDKHEIKIVCKNNKWCLLFCSKLVI